MKVKLNEDAFDVALQAAVGENKIGWTTHDHAHFLDGVLASLVDEKGKAVVLTVETKELIELTIAPSPALQRASLERIFREGDMDLDEESMKTIKSLIGVAQFGDLLAKTQNPETKRPYIGKVAKSERKNTLAALLGKTKTTQAAA
jgi:hypothetical protein